MNEVVKPSSALVYLVLILLTVCFVLEFPITVLNIFYFLLVLFAWYILLRYALEKSAIQIENGNLTQGSLLGKNEIKVSSISSIVKVFVNNPKGGTIEVFDVHSERKTMRLSCGVYDKESLLSLFSKLKVINPKIRIENKHQDI